MRLHLAKKTSHDIRTRDGLRTPLQFPDFRLIEDGDMYARIFNTYLVF